MSTIEERAAAAATQQYAEALRRLEANIEEDALVEDAILDLLSDADERAMFAEYGATSRALAASIARRLRWLVLAREG